MNSVVFGSLQLHLEELVGPECQPDLVSCSFSPLRHHDYVGLVL